MRFTDYQDVGDGMKNRHTDQQKGSVFWEKGKWDNYVMPHLPNKLNDLTYVDMGCNAGLFLKYAEDEGFGRVVGVDINPKAVERGIKYRRKVGGNWEIYAGDMGEMIDKMPVADYMSFINSHYYLLIQDWLNIVDMLHRKARFVIITSVRKYSWYCMASGRGDAVREYFRNWKLVSMVPQLPRENDPCPRSLWTLCYQSPTLERVSVDKLKRGAHVKTDFHEQIDQGVPPLKTNYFRRLCANHKNSPRKELEERMFEKVKMFESIKKNGVREPLIVNKKYRVLDGNHRANILKYLGYKTVIVRKV